jgi:hypothetical protein
VGNGLDLCSFQHQKIGFPLVELTKRIVSELVFRRRSKMSA